MSDETSYVVLPVHSITSHNPHYAPFRVQENGTLRMMGDRFYHNEQAAHRAVREGLV